MPCDQGWKNGDVIFFGKVVSISNPPGADPNRLSAKIVHFAVSDSFHGTVDMSKEVIVYTGSGMGDCGYPFDVGVSYLVYGTPYKDGFGTGTCSETAPEVRVGGALRELRELRDHARSDDLFGTLAMRPRGNGWRDLVDAQPLTGVQVTAVGNSGNRFSAISDHTGAYAFRNLPADLYGIEVNLPDGLVSREMQEYRPAPIDLQKRDKYGTGCRVDWFPWPDGRISGTIIDAGSGKPAGGFIDVKYLDQRKVPEMNTDMGPGAGVKSRDGKFELQGIFPGRFVLEFTPISSGNRWAKPILWPNESGMELSLGQHLDHLRITIARQ